MVVVSLEHHLAGLGSWVTFIMGLIFMACVLMFREGIVGTLEVALALAQDAAWSPPETPAATALTAEA